MKTFCRGDADASWRKPRRPDERQRKMSDEKKSMRESEATDAKARRVGKALAGLREWTSLNSVLLDESERESLFSIIDSLDERDGTDEEADELSEVAEPAETSGEEARESDANDTADEPQADETPKTPQTASAATGGDDELDPTEPLPIMPMSNILTDVAARKVMGYSIDSGNDALARSIRMKKAIKGGIGSFVPESVTDAVTTTATRALFRADALSQRVGEASERRRRGYAAADVHLLGIRFVRRLASMLSEISDITSDGLMGDAAESLERAVDWHEDGYYEAASLVGHDGAYEAARRVRREFDGAWAWVYENVLSAAGRSEGPDFRRSFWESGDVSHDAMDDVMLDGPVSWIGKVVSGEPTVDDLRRLPSAELERLSDMLDEFSEATLSWPEVYPDHPQISEFPDDWPERQYWDLLGGIRTRGAQESSERVTEVGQDGEEKTFIRTKTNEQMGLAFSAWTQDCHEAASVFDSWGHDNAGDPAVRSVMEVLTQEERERIVAQRKAAWDWFGRYAFCMAS